MPGPLLACPHTYLLLGQAFDAAVAVPLWLHDFSFCAAAVWLI